MSTGAASTVSKHSLIDHYSVRMMLLLNETVMLLLLLLEVLMALVHLYWCKSWWTNVLESNHSLWIKVMAIDNRIIDCLARRVETIYRDSATELSGLLLVNWEVAAIVTMRATLMVGMHLLRSHACVMMLSEPIVLTLVGRLWNHVHMLGTKAKLRFLGHLEQLFVIQIVIGIVHLTLCVLLV